MKKIVSILLIILMLYALAACGNGNSSASDDDPDKNATDNNSASGTAVAMTPEEKEAAFIEMFGNDVKIFPEMLSLYGGDVGYISDDVDHSARDAYQIAFVGDTSSAATKNLINAMYSYTSYYNFELEEAYSDGDTDKYITLLETYAMNGVDGFLVNPNNNIFPRVKEVLAELDIPAVWTLTAYKENGINQAPIVGEDNYTDGTIVMDWLLDNYKEYIGDIDLDKIGVIGLYWSVNIPMTSRVEAAEDIWNERFPGRENQFFYVDTAAQPTPVSQEGAYNEVSAFISSHTEYEYWVIASAAGLFANGAARAIEGLGLDDNALICSVGIEELINQWNSGYEGCWAGCVAIDPRIYAIPMISGIIAICDGRATEETLWSELRAEGDLATYYIMEPTVISKAEYLEYEEACNAVYEYIAN